MKANVSGVGFSGNAGVPLYGSLKPLPIRLTGNSPASDRDEQCLGQGHVKASKHDPHPYSCTRTLMPSLNDLYARTQIALFAPEIPGKTHASSRKKHWSLFQAWNDFLAQLEKSQELVVRMLLVVRPGAPSSVLAPNC